MAYHGGKVRQAGVHQGDHVRVLVQLDQPFDFPSQVQPVDLVTLEEYFQRHHLARALLFGLPDLGERAPADGLHDLVSRDLGGREGSFRRRFQRRRSCRIRRIGGLSKSVVQVPGPGAEAGSGMTDKQDVYANFSADC